VTALDDKMAELRRRFIARSTDELETIEKALAQGDRELLAERGHAIAGIAGMFGFGEIGKAALELERAALAGEDLASPAARLGELLTELAQT
jgi:HPt (histidine-containing phosphotransfer) domain-containing protein